MTSQLLYVQTLLALVAVAQCSTTSVVNSFESGVNSVRRTVKGLTDLADDGVNVGQKKVTNEYVPWLEHSWRVPIKQAATSSGASSDVIAKCSANDSIPAILEEVREEAVECVAERVPPGVPAIHEDAERLLRECDAFLAEAHAVAQQCEAAPSLFQSAMCTATRMAPMGGRVGILGGQAGVLGGSIAALIDGSARNCTAKASGWGTGTGREAKAKEAAAAIATCIHNPH